MCCNHSPNGPRTLKVFSLDQHSAEEQFIIQRIFSGAMKELTLLFRDCVYRKRAFQCPECVADLPLCFYNHETHLSHLSTPNCQFKIHIVPSKFIITANK